ncbi:MAG: hypothetical protein U9Q90_04800 [Campylobacterota bacterium]|nr:hypothetical protein [Campylobacterota bacterium]
MWKVFASILIVFVFLTGCSNKTPVNSSQTQQRIQSLYALLMKLDKEIDSGEAMDLAQSSVTYTQKLAQEYQVVSPPLFHNVLVNIGIKKRGLCFEWCDDLCYYLYKRKYKSFDLHPAGYAVGNYWREHNALVVTAKDQPFPEGVVLDGWRHSGELFFTPVKEDRKYDWAPRNDRCVILLRY